MPGLRPPGPGGGNWSRTWPSSWRRKAPRKRSSPRCAGWPRTRSGRSARKWPITCSYCRSAISRILSRCCRRTGTPSFADRPSGRWLAAGVTQRPPIASDGIWMRSRRSMPASRGSTAPAPPEEPPEERAAWPSGSTMCWSGRWSMTCRTSPLRWPPPSKRFVASRPPATSNPKTSVDAWGAWPDRRRTYCESSTTCASTLATHPSQGVPRHSKT